MRILIGLFAARVLQKEYGVDVVILEARDRTGGRTLTQTVSIRSAKSDLNKYAFLIWNNLDFLSFSNVSCT